MGYIVVIEGTDGCGKQTQAERLCKRLTDMGYKVRMQSFPNYDSPSASPVKMYLGGEFGDCNSLDAYQASILYSVDRLCTYKKDLEEFYKSGGILVCDRYVQSNMIHQAGKIRDRKEVDKYNEWLSALEFDALKLPRADRVLFLDVPIEISLKLKDERTELKAHTAKDVQESDVDHLVHAYESGKYVGEKLGWEMINCTENGKLKSIEEISDIIFDKIKDDIAKL